MKTVLAAFRQFMKTIWSDAMLAACLFAPLLMALVFRYGIPALENTLCKALGNGPILTPYYALFDLFLSLMTPVMLCFSGVMVVLEELDDGTARYLMVTPLGKAGYLVSRLVLLAVLSVGYNIALTAVFSLSGIPLVLNLLEAAVNSLVSISVTMLVVGFAKNKVEGMALVKLSGFFFLGYIAAYFVAPPAGMLAGVLPAYWLGRMSLDSNALWAVPAALTALVWIVLLYQRFHQRIV